MVSVEDYAQDPDEALVRGFCRYVGIPLPVDPTLRHGAQAQGLSQALRSVLSRTKEDSVIVMLSDLCTADDLTELRAVAHLAKRKRHQLVLCAPDARAFSTFPDAQDRLEEALVETALFRMQGNLVRAKQQLGAQGLTWLSCRPEDLLPQLLARLGRAAG